MIRILKKEIQNNSKKIRKNIKNNKGLPNTITLKDINNEQIILKKNEYQGLYQQKNIFQLKNNREPNYVTLNSKCNTLPIAINYQDTSYTCGPTSLSMASMCLYDYVSEKKCSEILETNKNGTSPDKLVNNSLKIGYKLTQISRDYNSVLESLQKGKPVIAHIQTRPATCLGYRGDYGHYILIYWCKNNEYFIADPSKGILKCRADLIDRATEGRSIFYYSVGVK